MDGCTFIVACVLFCLAASARGTVGRDPEEDMTFCQISEYNNYPCEEYLHQVKTADGFLLTLHRITGRQQTERPRRDASSRQHVLPRPIVFVQHGLLCDSTSWILNLPEDNLPYVLSDAGFDVWLGNSRGNTYSRKHETLDPDNPKFWEWSWDEMALYDLPASIDFVLNATGQKDLYYVGHSQGTLIAFTHLSLTHSTKIKYMVALGPVFHVQHMMSPIRLLAPYSYELELIFKLFGVRDFLPSSSVTHFLADYFCAEKSLSEVCADFLFTLVGADASQLNASRLPLYIEHTPAGTSVQNMIHYAQMVHSGVTGRFNYGIIENELRYGQPTPPKYTLNVTIPVSLYWAEKDKLADPQDVQFIANNLGNLRSSTEIVSWDHLDFIWAMDATSVVYDKVVSLFRMAATAAADESMP